MLKNKSLSNYQKLVLEAIDKNIAHQRTKEIISFRFGLTDGQRQTLEAIGQKYGITRERVRQIEEAAFTDLRKPVLIDFFKPVFRSIDIFLNQEGYLAREERLLSLLTGFSQPHPARGALFFILSFGQPYQRFVESEQFYPLWVNSNQGLKQAQGLIKYLINKLEAENQVVNSDFILKQAKSFNSNLSLKAILSYLDATKQINQNNLGYFGLVDWPEISPRGVKDKAYIILKKQTRPLHFREVTEFINQTSLGPKPAHVQTVHNELIKDDRFILVGRGIYALKEWGYQPGTVFEVIVKVLKENGPLTKEEILSKVLESRLVKPNTVLINLQNNKYFIKLADGKYSLIK